MTHPRSGGGIPAILYTLRKAREAGGFLKLWKAMRSKNACKTCALGMGGQNGGMVNESAHFPEVCKKSLQAMVADMQGGIPADFWSTYSVDQLRLLSSRELEACGRITTPLRYSPETRHYEPIPWDEALDAVAQNLIKSKPDKTFWYFSGRSSNEAGFLLQLFARLYGTNNVNNCSYYCHQASGVGLKSVIGSGTATIVLDDLDQADLVFLIGGNPASNHPRLMRTLMKLRNRGGKVVVINPIREPGLVKFHVPSEPLSLIFGTEIASNYIQPHIGGDLALLYGIAKRIVELGAHDEAFLVEHCNKWPDFLSRLEQISWEDIVQGSGVPAEEIQAIADVYANAKKAVFCWTMGITHHKNGVENVQAIANLALLRGMVGSPGCGLMPIRGHSNVQGVGSMGVTPRLSDAIFTNLESRFAVKLPTTPGLDTMACMEASFRQELTTGICLGGNLFGSNPDSTYASGAIAKLNQIVYLSTTLNTGHAHALAAESIILPVLARDEEPQPTTQESMFNYVRYSDGGPARHVGPRSEIDIIASIARRVFADTDGVAGPIDWNALADTAKIREMIAAVVPGYESIGLIDATKTEFQISGRTLHRTLFRTPDGKANLHAHQLPEPPECATDSTAPIRLMTIRSEGQFNTVVYEEEDVYRGVTARDVILLNPEDFVRLGLKDGDRVSVRGPAGKMTRIRATEFKLIRAGNAAMYYPEANVLLDRTVDPKSRTPAYKNVSVTISRADAFQHSALL